MLTIESLSFGNIDIAEDTVYVFPRGIHGYSKLNRFAILDREDSYPFKWLQSLEAPYVTLTMMDPNALMPEYSLSLEDNQMAVLELEDPSMAFVMVPVRIPRDPSKMTANFLGPFVFNFSRRIGFQAVVHGPEAWLRQPVVI